MKKLLTTLLSIISLTLIAQVPQGVGYQGVATDANGIELANQPISIRASVLSGSATGTIEWQETHATSTDTFGLFTLTIGQGTPTGNGAQANFADISWGTNTHFLKIEMDVTGGTNYSFMGTNQMMSVPYALYAESANINYDSISNLLSNDSTFITNVGGGMGDCTEFGDFISINTAIETQAASDGFLFGSYDFTVGGGGTWLKIFCDTFSGNSNIRAYINTNPYGGNFIRAGVFTIPIKEGEYFSFGVANGWATISNTYFVPLDCGGGGGSSSQNSSILNMNNIISDIQLNSNQGFQNGEFNYWSDNSFNDSAIFVVPQNKIMLIEGTSHSYISDIKLKRNNVIYSENDCNYLPLQIFSDIIFKENDTIIFNSNYSSTGQNSTAYISYFLYDNSDSLIEPIYKVLLDSSSYNIPNNKKLMIENYNYDCSNIYINSPNTGVILHSSLNQIPFVDNMSIISSCYSSPYCSSCSNNPNTFYNCYLLINGYLIDD